ncbi:hypothetical protein H0K60_004491 [Salmonella enterica]|nr:hypothetical protein [Salmonella enterica]EFR2649733.1 hypothetical protein [Salmonella enterica]EFS1408082.1 hypothetical protein [Salmonella enterica]EHQ8162530.1 hypothetical protein [Salmonella enterica]EJZ9218183.1 hypothetical protein [Salmonella enterica]
MLMITLIATFPLVPACYLWVKLKEARQEMYRLYACLHGWREVQHESELTRTLLTETLITVSDEANHAIELLVQLTDATEALDCSVGYSRREALARIHKLVDDLHDSYPVRANSKTIKLLVNNLGDRLEAEKRRAGDVECFSR